jgi:NADPH-dependent 2,4-dienoyl-CoA reductase/sulfur reductase-like enzyme
VQVIAFEQDDNISFIGADGLLWISGDVDDVAQTLYSSVQKLRNTGVELHMNTRVLEVDAQERTVITTSCGGQKVVESWDKLILATGSEPILPEISGIQLENVTTMKALQDTHKLKDIADNCAAKTIAVVGVAATSGLKLQKHFERCVQM